MRLIIIDGVSVEDIADILGMRHECVCVLAEDDMKEEKANMSSIKPGDRVQVNDPNTGCHRGSVGEIKDGCVYLTGIGWFSGEFISGIIL